jgi:hypothetical protein
MFRVLSDTATPRVAVVSLVLLATGLSACGSSDGTQAAVPARGTAATTAATTPPLTKAQQAAQAKQQAADLRKIKKQTEASVSKNIPKVTDTPETAVSIAKASPKKRSKRTIQGDMQTATEALDKAGQTATTVKVQGAASGAIQIQDTTVVFFSSDKLAATSSQTFTLALAANPNSGRISRSDNRVYIVNNSASLTPSDITQYKAVRKIVDKAL